MVRSKLLVPGAADLIERLARSAASIPEPDPVTQRRIRDRVLRQIASQERQGPARARTSVRRWRS